MSFGIVTLSRKAHKSPRAPFDQLWASLRLKLGLFCQLQDLSDGPGVSLTVEATTDFD
jgi:hypothetical protein